MLEVVQRVKQDTYGLGTGCAAPPPPSPAHLWCRGAREGLGAHGQVSALSTPPWARRGLTERPLGASAAPEPCVATSPLSPLLPQP